MTAESFLSSTVEIAIGLAGFAGIIAALRQRKITTWEPSHRILLQVLLAASGAAIFFSLLPALLREAGLAAEIIWVYGSGLLIVWLVGITIYRRKQSSKSGVRNLFFANIMVAWVLSNITLQIVNIFILAVSWPYLFGVFGLLVNGSIVFTILLFDEISAD